jgi:hypothetical protein
MNKRTYGESWSAPMEEIESFRQKLTKMMVEENFLKSQICNADEAGLFWRSLSENTKPVSINVDSWERNK